VKNLFFKADWTKASFLLASLSLILSWGPTAQADPITQQDASLVTQSVISDADFYILSQLQSPIGPASYNSSMNSSSWMGTFT